MTIEKEVFKEHFNRKLVEDDLQKKGVFLSSMKKRKVILKTDDCKSLFF